MAYGFSPSLELPCTIFVLYASSSDAVIAAVALLYAGESRVLICIVQIGGAANLPPP